MSLNPHNSIFQYEDYASYRGFIIAEAPMPQFAPAFASVIEAIQLNIERYIGTKLEYQLYEDEYLDGTGEDFLQTKNRPIRQLVSLFAGANELDVADFRLNTEAGEIVALKNIDVSNFGHNKRFIAKDNFFRANYWAGWVDGTADPASPIPIIPFDIKYAAWVLADTALAQRGVNLNAAQESQGNRTTAFRGPVDTMVVVNNLLSPFRKLPG